MHHSPCSKSSFCSFFKAFKRRALAPDDAYETENFADLDSTENPKQRELKVRANKSQIFLRTSHSAFLIPYKYAYA
jgi:hypothetical protein